MARAHSKEDHLIVMKESELHEGRARIKVVGCGGGGGDGTRGRAAGGKGGTGRTAVVQGSDRVSSPAGMGGGTGTGSAAIVAELAKEAGALTIGVVTRPFAFEGRIRNDTAEEGIKALR